MTVRLLLIKLIDMIVSSFLQIGHGQHIVLSGCLHIFLISIYVLPPIWPYNVDTTMTISVYHCLTLCISMTKNLFKNRFHIIYALLFKCFESIVVWCFLKVFYNLYSIWQKRSIEYAEVYRIYCVYNSCHVRRSIHSRKNTNV